jgi:hypothetical protein
MNADVISAEGASFQGKTEIDAEDALRLWLKVTGKTPVLIDENCSSKKCLGKLQLLQRRPSLGAADPAKNETP